MAKKDTAAQPKSVPAKREKKPSDKPPFFQRLKKIIREVISELKKVEWPPFKQTKNVSGVWAQTGVVLIVVAFFLVIMVAFDSGLLALLNLLTKG